MYWKCLTQKFKILLASCLPLASAIVTISAALYGFSPGLVLLIFYAFAVWSPNENLLDILSCIIPKCTFIWMEANEEMLSYFFFLCVSFWDGFHKIAQSVLVRSVSNNSQWWLYDDLFFHWLFFHWPSLLVLFPWSSILISILSWDRFSKTTLFNQALVSDCDLGVLG